MALQIEKQCGPKCKSRLHAYNLNTAITRGSLRQVQLYAGQCHNPFTLSDHYGRTALHMSASKNKWDIVEWLLESKIPDLSTRDWESGWTALHRALFYGQLTTARLLIAHGANVLLRDKEGLTPFDITMKDRLAHVDFTTSGLNDVYTWGDNSNFTLGHDTEQRRKYPEGIENLRKEGIHIKEVVMSKYHSAFLSTAGSVYTCGHGRGGRLGHGNELTCLVPKRIESLKGEVCVQIAASRDHMVILTESGSVYSCGINDHHQLGQLPQQANQMSLVPKVMNGKTIKGKMIRGICAQRFHTVLYTNDAVFTFGLNAGQLGHHKVQGETHVSQPRLVSALNHKDVEIEMVSSSDAATVVVTKKGDVYVLHEYRCRKIASKWLNIVQVVVSGGHLDHRDMQRLREGGGTELIIILLNSSGRGYIWRGSEPNLKRIAWTIKRPIHITQLAISTSNIAFITKDGEAYLGHIPQTKKAAAKETNQLKDQLASSPPLDSFTMTISELVEKEDIENIPLDRLPMIHRATAITTDRKGHNFAALQASPNSSLTEIPSVQGSEMTHHFLSLLEEANECDSVHDCIIKVGSHCIPAHKYILSFRSEFFRNLFLSKCEESLAFEKPVVEVEGVDYEMFLQVLKFLYTDECDMLTVGKSFDLKTKTKQNTDMKLLEDGFDMIDIDVGKKVSAFEVYDKKKKKKGSKKKGKEAEIEKKDTDESGSKNPVRALQDLAKKFGIKTLLKRLEAVKYSNGIIQKAQGKSLQPPRLRFDRSKLSSLYDVNIQSDDGKQIKCHKAILVARLEYFHSMFGSGWIETSNAKALTLPVPENILEIIVDYLYTDEAQTINGCEEPEFICNVLVVADQLLITRLREICEVVLANLVSLRNVSELLEFASVYNADQLKATCQQFISLNIAPLLEGHYLDLLSSEVMEELTEYYRNMIPGMYRRMITPYDDPPDSNYLESLEAEFGEEISENMITEETPSKKGKSKKRRSRTKSSGEDQMERDRRLSERKISMSSDTGVLDDIDEVMSEFSPKEESRKTHRPSQPIMIPKRDLSIRWGPKSPDVNIAQTPIETKHITCPQSPTCLQSPISPFRSPGPMPQSLRDGSGLRNIMAQQSQENTALSQTAEKSLNPTPNKLNKKSGKLSQKERKKLLTKQETTDGDQSIKEDTRVNAWGNVPASNPWGSISKAVSSFKDLMVDEETKITTVKTPTVSVTPKKFTTVAMGPGGDTTLSWGLPMAAAKKGKSGDVPQSPVSPRTFENPWQKSISSGMQSFTEIVKDEQQQTEVLYRNTNKPLALIQSEEQAMNELLMNYGADENFDQYITVERVTTAIATPTWAAAHRH